MNISSNTSIASLGEYLTKLGLLKHKELKQAATQFNETLRTKTPTMETLIQNLSGETSRVHHQPMADDLAGHPDHG